MRLDAEVKQITHAIRIGAAMDPESGAGAWNVTKPRFSLSSR